MLVWRAGRHLPEPALAGSRDLAREQLARLPAALRELDCADDFRLEISPWLRSLAEKMCVVGR